MCTLKRRNANQKISSKGQANTIVLLKGEHNMIKTTQNALKRLLAVLMVISLVFASATIDAVAASSDATEADVKVYDAIRNWRADMAKVQPPSSYDEVYSRIIACKEIIPQGTVWTDYMPYGVYNSNSPHAQDDPRIGYLGKVYTWNGGVYKVYDGDPGSQSGTGCAAFAPMISDAAFGSMPCRVVRQGNVRLENVHPGDILRVANNSHTVIVLQTTEEGAIVAEANVKLDSTDTKKIGRVNWGRAISKADVENSAYMLTRYVEGQDYSGGTEETIVKQGNLGSVQWSLTNKGVLTFSGSGPIPNFATWDSEDDRGIWNLEELERPWEASDVKTKVSSIKIESGITSIGACAFCKTPALSVSIPDTVKTIGLQAFKESKIISLSISAETIGSEAFYRCENLKTLELCEGITTIGARAFYGCSGATSGVFNTFIIPASVRTIGAGAFSYFNSIPGIAFAPNSKLTTIGGGTFAGCRNMFAAELPEGLTKLEDGLFQSNTSLYKIYIPKSVTEISETIFLENKIMEEVYFGGTEAQWNSLGGNYAIAKDKTHSMFDIKVYYNTSPDDFKAGSGSSHTHNWSESWEKDDTAHWHNCTVSNCDVSENTLKSGYGLHTFGDWIIDTEATISTPGTKHRTCTPCEYSETGTIPVITDPSVPGPSSKPSSSPSPYPTNSPSTRPTNPPSPSLPDDTTTSIKTNPDGSVTTTEKNNKTGTVTETTKFKDGTVVTKITESDGTKTTEQKNSDGSELKTVEKPDGSRSIKSKEVSGTTTNVDMSATGKLNAEVNLSQVDVDDNPNAVTLPIPDVPVTSKIADVSVLKIDLPANNKNVNIVVPLNERNTGVVAIIVKDDGSEEIVRKCTLSGSNLVVPLSGNATIKIIDKSIDFADVSSNHWATDSVAFASSHGLFVGVGGNKFAPNANMSRSMLVTVLYNLENRPVSNGTIDFADVGSEDWYTEAMKWATTNKIVSGYGNGVFGPKNNVTREQIATIMYRYANAIGVETTEQGSITKFKDGGNTSSWARNAMSWAIGAKLFSGDGQGNLKPTDSATRAEVATILMSFVKYIHHSSTFKGK